MDFYKIRERTVKKDTREVYPEFQVLQSKDLMVRGKNFWAVWDEKRGLWSQNEYDVRTMVDDDLRTYRDSMRIGEDEKVNVKLMTNFSSSSWLSFCNYVSHLSDNYHQLDEKLTFADTPVEKGDYISRRLPYSLHEGEHKAFDTIMETLYDEEERKKILWCIGSIVSGDSKKIQKFAVLYGPPGHGKGTVLDIIQLLFGDYCVSFSAKDLVTGNNQFATEIFRFNPLVCVDADAKLSRIEDNTILNTLVSHERMLMKEKFKQAQNGRSNAFLFMGTNDPVKISDAKSGILRRLIDISPSGRLIKPETRYFELKEQLNFELGAIAQYCLDIYKSMGRHYYDGYRPIGMMYRTNPFFNFVKEHYVEWKNEDGVSLKNAYTMYKEYCDESGMKRLEMYKFRDELKNYFLTFEDQARVDGKQVRSWFSGFLTSKFDMEQEAPPKEKPPDIPKWLKLKSTKSLLDEVLSGYPAQYASDYGDKKEVPTMAWSKLKTTLKDLDTTKLHYVLTPKNLIFIDFDLKNEKGEKDAEKNLKSAAQWPETYAEYSKSGKGLHLYYWYEGPVERLDTHYAPDIEIKVPVGGSSLRRKLSLCNDIPIAAISSGLPFKEEKVVDFEGIKNDKHLIALIEKALRKEIAPGATKTSIDFIEKILNDAYEQGIDYDVSEMAPRIVAFASNSSHQAAYCLTRVCLMKFKSRRYEHGAYGDIKANQTDILPDGETGPIDDRLAFFDVEVFPNLFLVNWKWAGDTTCQRMINPQPKDIEPLLKMKLVGFNCRRYDNHILYARYIGRSLEELYELSQKIVCGSRNAMFGNAYDISYTDVYDFCSKKQSLKKWEIELGFHHQELGLKWDEPVPEDQWLKVAEYCDNDVFATEAVFNARQADWTARRILADISGMTVNDTTNSLTTRIIFGDDREPQKYFNYRDMGDVTQIAAKERNDPYTAFDANGRPIFPGYKMENGKSLYRGEDVGSGGYVYAEPGLHLNVALLDISSMHPSSMKAENLFGDIYQPRFNDLLEARILIKHKEYDKASKLFDGKLSGYLQDENQAKALAGALKIAINSVYGLTSATFDNPFRDIRNVDNIVAKRGALFMVNLKHRVQEKGFTVAHIKTDSIKIPNATEEIIEFVKEYGKLYGYSFEHEATYDRMCLVNDAVYIARHSETSEEYVSECRKAEKEGGIKPTPWTATGTQFQVPYVFKTLFSKEPVEFSDLCETKTVTSALYLDFNENLPDVSEQEKEQKKLEQKLWKLLKEDAKDEQINELDIRIDELEKEIEKGHKYIFVGKAGLFCPIKKGCGGGLLMREKDGKYYAATGTTGYRWKEAEIVQTLRLENEIDRGYFDRLADEAKKAITKYCDDFEMFVSEGPFVKEPDDIPPWCSGCDETGLRMCQDCEGWDPVQESCKGVKV